MGQRPFGAINRSDGRANERPRINEEVKFARAPMTGGRGACPCFRRLDLGAFELDID
jgi:hypothetical protein